MIKTVAARKKKIARTRKTKMDPRLKEKAEKVFHGLGLSKDQAMVLFYEDVASHKKLPFKAKIPNKTTIEAMEDIENNRNLTTYHNLSDLFKKHKK